MRISSLRVPCALRLRSIQSKIPPKDLGTIDADAIVWLPNAGDADADTVLAAIEQRFREGSRVQSDIVQLRRGIRIEYADENPGFHIEITPARAVQGNNESNGQGKLEVPDRVTGWKASSSIPYACTSSGQKPDGDTVRKCWSARSAGYPKAWSTVP